MKLSFLSLLIIVWVEPDFENDLGDLKCMWLFLDQTLHYCLVCVFGLGLVRICFHQISLMS